MSAEGLLYAAWRGLSRLLRPALGGLLILRVRRGKEDPERLPERRGRASRARPEGPLVWVHCASVGETNAVLPLIEQLTARGMAVLLTTTTLTASRVAADRLPEGAFHQFGPLDVVTYLDRFLSHWRPTLAIFVESELWPVALDELARRDIPRIVVNGRMSERSARGWGRFPLVHRAIFSRITEVFAQSAADADRFRALGAPKVGNLGNLKYDGAILSADPAALQALRAAIGDRPAWVASSTHPGEEQLIAQVHRRLAADFPGLVTVIVPRHPERGADIAAELRSDDLAISLRSAGEPVPAGAGIYVADTLAELGLFYRLVSVVFVGGSLVEKGGQNPIEPARLGCAVIAGPHTGNFPAVYEALMSAGGGIQVDGPDGLATVVARLLADPEEVERIAETGAQVALSQTGAVDRTMDALKAYLPVSAPTDERPPIGAAR
ncbi:3-deoxy-D-manno-octulosonic acid transferase [Amorphus orientalis]|uniref:3-deoxy-D-manno-octulosonic acid transferase n=1 Tax=Amorphus orientalis TaxID=649198 RepID=A0AAE4AU25_9HYPH|nr:3-deoxy-D-manno-octulosonic acid transferase [Amorphus orientalis]MDQ0316722.1 3-deoxy-D-manno-octulosonic-acid transferase [Amorphus orientalis]